jgi:hypothetical protein
MNWYNELKSQEAKTAGLFDSMFGGPKKPSAPGVAGLSGAPKVGPAGRMTFDDPNFSNSSRALRDQLSSCESRVNKLKLQVKSNPALQAELQKAIAEHAQVLNQMANQTSKEYSLV